MLNINGITYYKVNEDYRYSLQTVTLFNGVDSKKIIVDDTEYQYGDGLISTEFSLDTLKLLRKMSINEEYRKKWKFINGVITEGNKVKVIKGRKSIGCEGIIEKLYNFYDKYGRYVAEYSIIKLENGEKIKINTSNLQIIAI